MGYLSYVLIMLAGASIFSKMKWLIPIRKYIISTFLMVGCFLAMLYWLPKDRDLTIYFACGTILGVISFIYVLANRKKKPIYKIKVPADSYDIVALDRNAPTPQLSYYLRYQGKVYGISTIPPVGKPALTLYAMPQPNQEWILADISIDHDKTPKTPKYILGCMYAFLIFVIVMLIPFFTMGGTDGSVPDFYLGVSLSVVLGYLDYIVVKDKKGLYYRFIYYFSWFLTIVGWGGLLVNLILPS